MPISSAIFDEEDDAQLMSSTTECRNEHVRRAGSFGRRQRGYVSVEKI
jgi:hypothetical protein